MAAKTTCVPNLCYILLHDFWFLQYLKLINLCLMFFRSKWSLFDLQIQNCYRRHTHKTVFMHVNYNIINNICLSDIYFKYNLKNKDYFCSDKHWIEFQSLFWLAVCGLCLLGTDQLRLYKRVCTRCTHLIKLSRLWTNSIRQSSKDRARKFDGRSQSRFSSVCERVHI